MGLEHEQRKLTDIAIRDERWSKAVHESSWYGEQVAMQAVYHGLHLADAVAIGGLAVVNLREFVSWANDLDREAVAESGGDIKTLTRPDYSEAVARRIAHHSGRTALGMVRSADRRSNYRVEYKRRVRALHAKNNTSGFRLEARDVGL